MGVGQHPDGRQEEDGWVGRQAGGGVRAWMALAATKAGTDEASPKSAQPRACSTKPPSSTDRRPARWQSSEESGHDTT